MATYRYHFCDALTGVLLDELPLSVQSFSQSVSAAGTLTGTLALGALAGIDWRSATVTKRTLLVVLRDEQIAWAGLVMRRRKQGDTAEIGAETLEGYWTRRRIKTDLTYTGADVLDIVRGTLTQLQGLAGGNLRMTVSANTAGQVATVAYLGKDRTVAAQAWARLAEVAPGFEWTIGWTRTGTVYTPAMTLAAPGLGVTLDATVLEFPGSVADYDYPEDGTAAPNAVTGIGADSGGSPLLSEAVDTTGEIAAGVPLFEDEVQMKDESDPTRLAARTQTALAAGLVDYVVPTVELAPGGDPGFGSLVLGAPVRLRATSLYHPAGQDGRPGLDVTRRITGWTVSPGGAEKVTLTLATTTGKITRPAGLRDQGAYLANLDRRLRALETT